MRVAFDYACNQVLGLTFEPFTLRYGGETYVWQPTDRVRSLCQWLVMLRLTVVAGIVFRWGVR